MDNPGAANAGPYVNRQKQRHDKVVHEASSIARSPHVSSLPILQE
jgi:hypothetical protein